MSYKNRYTFGEKTTSQIAALTGMVQGDTVWNTDSYIEEYYTGDVWTNDQCVLMTAGTTIVEGEQVAISLTDGDADLLTTGNNEEGIGVCVYGGTAGDVISVQVMGVARCLAGASVVLGQYATQDGTAGRFTDTTSAGTGTFGRVLENGVDGDLVRVLLSFIERA